MKAIGIIWNMGEQFFTDILNDINSIQNISYIKKYELKDEYENFVLDCYFGDSEAFLEGYIYEKINSMKLNANTTITIFEIEINNPSFKTNPEINIKQCVETKFIKQKIREKYSNKINGYF